MINPDQQEKHLAPMDVKIKNKVKVVTLALALAIVLGLMAAAELVVRIFSFFHQ